MTITRATTIGGHAVLLADGALCFSSGLEIDADGCPRAYHPDGKSGLDFLANAGKPGNWYGLVCDPHGDPIVQGPSDLAPGFYVSSTALVDRSRPVGDPRRYVDSDTVPYLAVPPELLELGIYLGDLAVAVNAANGRACSAVIADVGPHRKIGEGSIALARALGIPFDPRHGGTDSGVATAAFPGSGRGWPRSNEDVALQAVELFAGWGGQERLLGTVRP